MPQNRIVDARSKGSSDSDNTDSEGESDSDNNSSDDEQDEEQNEEIEEEDNDDGDYEDGPSAGTVIVKADCGKFFRCLVCINVSFQRPSSSHIHRYYFSKLYVT